MQQYQLLVRYYAQGQLECLGILEYKVIRKGDKKVLQVYDRRYKTNGTRQKVSKEYQKEIARKILDRLYNKGTEKVYRRYQKGKERGLKKSYRKNYTVQVYDRYILKGYHMKGIKKTTPERYQKDIKKMLSSY